MIDFLKPETKISRCNQPAAPCNAPQLFSLGRTSCTQTAVALLQKHGVHVSGLLARHQSGDWGAAGADGIASNARMAVLGTRIISVYRLLDAAILSQMTPEEQRRTPTVWIVTEGNSATTVLTPKDF
jgi:hypothetical protein